jgi:hypothetical protein
LVSNPLSGPLKTLSGERWAYGRRREFRDDEKTRLAVDGRTGLAQTKQSATDHLSLDDRSLTGFRPRNTELLE